MSRSDGAARVAWGALRAKVQNIVNHILGPRCPLCQERIEWDQLTARARGRLVHRYCDPLHKADAEEMRAS